MIVRLPRLEFIRARQSSGMEVWRGVKWVLRKWDAVQVDLNGQYSLDRFAQLNAFCQQWSWLSVLVRCLVTPLPCILFLLLMDCVKLEPTTTPPLQSPVFWTRGYVVTLTMTGGILEQFRRHNPALGLSSLFIFVTSTLSSTLGVASAMLWSVVIGHPLPFSMLIAAPPWMTTIVVCIYIRVRRTLCAAPALKKDLIAYYLFSQLRLSLTLVYPAYVYVFASLTSFAQIVFVLVLPLIKVTAKNLMGRALRDHDDLKPEALIFNVEVFHALFVSYSMQSATSIGTALVLMAIDAMHAWTAILDINHLVDELRVLSDAAVRVGNDQRHGLTQRELDIVAIAQTVLTRDAYVRQHRSIRPTTFILENMGTMENVLMASDLKPPLTDIIPTSPPMAARSTRQIVPLVESTAATTTGDQQSAREASQSSPEAVMLVRKTLQLLYVTEFIVLIEFVEIVVPIIFSTYMLAMFHLPNREYYPLLAGMTDEQLAHAVQNVFIYSLLEVMSFVTMSCVLWWRVRVSALHQLAFVLEKHWLVIQWGLVTWVSYVVQTSLAHYGFDYSFRFAWLHAAG